jgi:hypothetical protein
VVVVAVRDEHPIDLGRRALHAHDAAEVRHPVAQQRIREQTDAVQLDEHRGVTDVPNDQ